MAESIDERLQREEQRAEEQKRREALMQRDQQERLEQEQAEEEEAAEEGYDGEPLEPDMNRPGQMDAAKEHAKEAAKRAMSRYGKKVAGKAAARYGATAVIGATSWAWGPALLVIAGIFLIFALVMVIFLGIISTCNQDGFTGALVRFSSSIAAKIGISEDICEIVNVEQNLPIVAEPIPLTSDPIAGTPSDLVNITIPTEGAADFRVRQCMNDRIISLYNRAQKAGISFVVTSAFRPGAIVAGSSSVSAHSRGEAIDIAIRPPSPPYDLSEWLADKNFQLKISSLYGFSRDEGFKPAQGDTLDEYNHPTEGATGGHIHIEFNVPKNGGSYCKIGT